MPSKMGSKRQKYRFFQTWFSGDFRGQKDKSRRKIFLLSDKKA